MWGEVESRRKRQDAGLPVLFQHSSTVPQAGPPCKANHHANKKGMLEPSSRDVCFSCYMQKPTHHCKGLQRLSTGPRDGPLHLSPTEAALVLPEVLINTPSCLRHCTQKYCSSHTISTPGLRAHRGMERDKSSPVPTFWGQPQL